MRRRLVLLALAFPIGAALWIVGVWTGSLLAAVLLVIVPGLAFAQVKPLREQLPPPEVIYHSSIGSHLVLGGLALWAGVREFGADALGLQPLPGREEWGWGLLLVLLLLGLTAGFQLATRALGIEEGDLIRVLIPTTVRQRLTFGVMSITAGLAEEIVYRGYLFLVLLAAGMPLVWALAVSSLAFGAVHAYQGSVGIIRTALLGLTFGISFVALDSLWPAIISHTLFDAVVGLVLADHFLGPTEPATEPPPVVRADVTSMD